MQIVFTTVGYIKLDVSIQKKALLVIEDHVCMYVVIITTRHLRTHQE